MDPSRPGTFHCFKGGKWMPQETVSGVIDQACTSTAEHDGDNVHFSFVPSADGTFPHQQVDHQFRACRSDQSGPLVCQPASGVVSFTGDIKSAARANSNDCTYAMQRIIDICHGEHEDTRGGWWQYDSDGTTYGVDPAE
ncbi:MAG: hypothetical protein HETSPECPRED_009099 [Heterodermia speciosa]|uniref:Uncharacterized protein n=1 Tax=Heterodermia speciosa TaxID=116794 RepID=A0A8H3G3F1_9LECA|nr:MAG: hypothetical protein HETSPECPRED_009099 [Heterodermia speciosa]